jgi:hypothetical protein
MKGGRGGLKGAVVETVAGDGARACRDGSLLQASLSFPYGLCWEACKGQSHEQSHGVLLVSEWEGHRVRRIDLRCQMVTTLAGTGRSGFLDGPAHQALFHEPCMLASDPNSGIVYVADSKNNAIRVILPPAVEGVGVGGVERTHTVVTLLGPPPSAPSRDAQGGGGVPVPLCVCELWRPWGVFVDSEGCLLISEAKSHRVRRLRDPLRFLTHELLARQLAAEEAREAAVPGFPPPFAPPPILPLRASTETNMRLDSSGPDMGPRRAVSPSEELLDWRHSPEFDRFRQFLSGSPQFGQARDRDGGGRTGGGEGAKGGGGGGQERLRGCAHRQTQKHGHK